MVLETPTWTFNYSGLEAELQDLADTACAQHGQPHHYLPFDIIVHRAPGTGLLGAVGRQDSKESREHLCCAHWGRSISL